MIKKQKAVCPLCFIPLLLGGKKSRKQKRTKNKLIKFDIKVVLGKNDIEEDIKLRPKPKDWSSNIKKKILNHIKQCVKSFLKYRCQLNKIPIIEWKNNNTLTISVHNIDCKNLKDKASRHGLIIFELQNNNKTYRINKNKWELLISVK
jgi:hypothetical protein